MDNTHTGKEKVHQKNKSKEISKPEHIHKTHYYIYMHVQIMYLMFKKTATYDRLENKTCQICGCFGTAILSHALLILPRLYPNSNILQQLPYPERLFV